MFTQVFPSLSNAVVGHHPLAAFARATTTYLASIFEQKPGNGWRATAIFDSIIFAVDSSTPSWQPSRKIKIQASCRAAQRWICAGLANLYLQHTDDWKRMQPRSIQRANRRFSDRFSPKSITRASIVSHSRRLQPHELWSENMKRAPASEPLRPAGDTQHTDTRARWPPSRDHLSRATMQVVLNAATTWQPCEKVW